MLSELKDEVRFSPAQLATFIADNPECLFDDTDCKVLHSWLMAEDKANPALGQLLSLYRVIFYTPQERLNAQVYLPFYYMNAVKHSVGDLPPKALQSMDTFHAYCESHHVEINEILSIKFLLKLSKHILNPQDALDPDILQCFNATQTPPPRHRLEDVYDMSVKVFDHWRKKAFDATDENADLYKDLLAMYVPIKSVDHDLFSHIKKRVEDANKPALMTPYIRSLKIRLACLFRADYHSEQPKDYSPFDTIEAVLTQDSYDKIVNAYNKVLESMKPGELLKPENLTLPEANHHGIVITHMALDPWGPQCMNFQHADLRHTFWGSLPGRPFVGNDFSYALLSQSTMDSGMFFSKFTHADLRLTWLSGSFAGTDFSFAKMDGIDLKGASLFHSTGIEEKTIDDYLSRFFNLDMDETLSGNLTKENLFAPLLPLWKWQSAGLSLVSKYYLISILETDRQPENLKIIREWLFDIEDNSQHAIMSFEEKQIILTELGPWIDKCLKNHNALHQSNGPDVVFDDGSSHSPPIMSQ